MPISIREYGCLGTCGVSSGLDYQVLPVGTYEHVKRIALEDSYGSRVFRLTGRGKREVIQVQNFVGVLVLPNGDQLEIVPKTTLDADSVERARIVLLRMLAAVYDIRFTETDLATLRTLKRPWIETLIRYVLQAIAACIRPGLRRSYRRIAAVAPYLRGQLQLKHQLRQRPGKQHMLHISYEELSANRPENRLLKSCVEQLLRWTSDDRSRQLSRDLLFALSEVPHSADVAADLRQWSAARDMARYTPLLPWVRLILNRESPLFAHGRSTGVSLLFPMEQMFENFVYQTLRRQLARSHRAQSQARSRSLAQHKAQLWFRLQPDIFITRGTNAVSVLDTKWKLLDASLDNSSDKYNVSEADIYQLYAYSQTYLGGEGNSFLIYPRHARFTQPLAPFHFSERMRLWIVPFDLDAACVRWPSDVTPVWLAPSVGAAA